MGGILNGGAANFQRGHYRGHRLESIVGILSHHLAKYFVKLLGHVGPLRRKRRDFAAAVRQQFFHHRIGRIRRGAHQQAVHGAAQAVDITAGVGCSSVFCLLRAHVVDRAHDLLAARHAMTGERFGPAKFLIEARQSHVENFHRAALVDQKDFPA